MVKEDGTLDTEIWHHELTPGKRLSKHAKKAVAPIILLGYFRDVLRLSYPERNLQEKDYTPQLQLHVTKMYHDEVDFLHFAIGCNV